MAKTADALKILERVIGKDTRLRAEIDAARNNLEIASMIYEARTRAGLSQRELADLIGTKQPVIARLEDADYDGHSLTMLRRIAEALGQDLRVQISPTRFSKRGRVGSFVLGLRPWIAFSWQPEPFGESPDALLAAA